MAPAWLSLPVLICTAAVILAEAPAPPKPAEELPDLTESSKLQDKMPATVSGVVTLAGKGCAGVRVTDGVDFVTTDKDGHYTITLKPDPLVPYLPNRTVAVSWPSGTWPVRDEKSGRYRWATRLMDVQDPQNVDFELVKRDVSLPLCVAFATDPHDVLSRPLDMIFNTDIANAPGHVAFAVMGGDLGYASFGNSEDIFRTVGDYTNKFPVMLLHCVGNHDMVGKHFNWPDAPRTGSGKHTSWFGAPHPAAGYGGFIKWLNPVHWSFDCAGIRFIGLDYGTVEPTGAVKNGISDSAIEWLERDLASKPQDAPAYFFNHQPWSPNQRFYEVCAKYGVRLCLGGDTHRNMFLNSRTYQPGTTQYWSKANLYTRLYVDKTGFDFVDVCVNHGARNGWDGYWNHDLRGCALYNDPPETVQAQRGEHSGIQQTTLDSTSQELKVVKGETYDLRFGAMSVGSKPAKRWGLRIHGTGGGTLEFAYDNQAHVVTLMGLQTPFDPAIPTGHGGQPESLDPKQQEWVEMRIFVLPDMVRVLVNNRLHTIKALKPGELKKIEFFAEDGSAEFGRVDVWQRSYEDYNPRLQFNRG